MARKINLGKDYIDMFSRAILRKVSNIFFKIYELKSKRIYKIKQRYLYRLDSEDTYVKRNFYDERFLSVRIIRLYYFTFKDFQFRVLFRKASKLNGELETNYCYLLEGRLSSIVYRS